MQTTTREVLPPGTLLMRVFPKGLSPEDCIPPKPYKWCTNVTPPVPFEKNGKTYQICEVKGAADIGCTHGEVRSILAQVKEEWPWATNIWWEHDGIAHYRPSLK